MTAEKTRPPMDAHPLVILSHCYGLPADQIEALIEELGERQPSLEDDDWWNHHDTLAEGVALAETMGLPLDPTQHQQPWDVARLLTMLPIHSDASNDRVETRVNRGLHLLTSDQSKALFKTHPPEQAYSRIRWTAVELNHYFGSNNRVIRESRLREYLDGLEWFTDTEGLHDPHSGDVDVDAAALRKYRKWGRA